MVQNEKVTVPLVRNPIFYLQLLMVAAVARLGTPYMAVATVAFCFLLWGVLYRKHRVIHAWLMNTGIALDLALVLILQVERDAVQTAVSFTLGPMQQAHIAFSSVATVLYFPILYIGWRLFRQKKASRKWHIRLGTCAFVARALGLIMMFSLLKG